MLKKLWWVGSSKKDLKSFPEEVIREIGYALYEAQKGDTHESAKMFKGCGSGVFEIVSDFNKNAFRAVYIVNIKDAVYVIHAFQKKSKTGIKTPQEHVDLIKDRIKRLKETLKEDS
ncbi:MAG: type II toxin-antitoxin system RelE/ParE family toxin [Pseudomonadota bacterium]